MTGFDYFKKYIITVSKFLDKNFWTANLKLSEQSGLGISREVGCHPSIFKDLRLRNIDLDEGADNFFCRRDR